MYTNGEVSWPIGEAELAINALADAGVVILGLDVRHVDKDGRTQEVAWSSFSRLAQMTPKITWRDLARMPCWLSNEQPRMNSVTGFS